MAGIRRLESRYQDRSIAHLPSSQARCRLLRSSRHVYNTMLRIPSYEKETTLLSLRISQDGGGVGLRGEMKAVSTKRSRSLADITALDLRVTVSGPVSKRTT